MTRAMAMVLVTMMSKAMDFTNVKETTVMKPKMMMMMILEMMTMALTIKMEMMKMIWRMMKVQMMRPLKVFLPQA